MIIPALPTATNFVPVHATSFKSVCINAGSEGRKRRVQVTPSVGYQTGPGVLEAGVRVPLAGRNLPAGPAIVLGYFFTFEAF